MIDATTPVAPLISQNHGVGFRSMADTMRIEAPGMVKTTHAMKPIQCQDVISIKASMSPAGG